MAELNQRQRARLEKAERFLRTAQQALRDEDYESCVSRAYYAVYHCILALLPLRSGRKRHIQVINECVEWNQNNRGILDGVGLIEGYVDWPSSLRGLYRWRNEADYELGMTGRLRAQNTLSFAGRFLAVAKEVIQ